MTVRLVDTWKTATGIPSPTVVYPTGIQKNNLIVLFVACNAAAAVTTPAGYTVIRSVTQGTLKLTLLAKMASGTESGNLAVTVASGLSVALLGAYKSSRFTSTLASHIDATFTDAFGTAATTTVDTILVPTDPDQFNSVFIAFGAGRNVTAARACSFSDAGWDNGTAVNVASGGAFIDGYCGHHAAFQLRAIHSPVFTFSGAEVDLAAIGAAISEPRVIVPSNRIITRNPWLPPSFTQPTSFTQRQMQQLRANVLFSIVGGDTPYGWNYATSVGENMGGTYTVPARFYYAHGNFVSGTYAPDTQWVKVVPTYDRSSDDTTKKIIAAKRYFYSPDNQATYVPMTDDLGNNAVTFTRLDADYVALSDWGYEE